LLYRRNGKRWVAVMYLHEVADVVERMRAGKGFGTKNHQVFVESLGLLGRLRRHSHSNMIARKQRYVNEVCAGAQARFA
jgi:hypothetical protein